MSSEQLVTAVSLRRRHKLERGPIDTVPLVRGISVALVSKHVAEVPVAALQTISTGRWGLPSGSSRTALSTLVQNPGHPQPQSNFISDVYSSVSQPA
eukprot:CAMPEP_0174837294 /NCGR_PEP_ID=MMETSP1114-20130205/6642_1 /TAXON_ID=312471 /ORGANISM="Neobodo designis, Strain CCAP 1951/1" /LENGTH=96 /DNA_ID=CAMNT_0016071345 /DNA_START=15 /DNA_END=303 /DNA_ORIENTATION=+